MTGRSLKTVTELLAAWTATAAGYEGPDTSPLERRSPASGADLDSLETRVGRSLPPSYRDFLSCTDGWGPWWPEWPAFRPSTRVCWLRDDDASDIFDFYLPALLAEEPPEAARAVVGEWSSLLLVSDREQSARFLLNPGAVTDSGEWEAWAFAAWLPDPRKYRTFWDLLNGEFEIYAHTVA